ncbi:MAG: NAD(P)-binding domain-containing protein, partial [Candidatus Thorarchaeota archaeon]
MRVSMQGLGRLGLPVACAMVLQGHEVYGYDIDSDKREQFKLGKCDYYEPDIDRILPDCLNSGLHIVDTVAEAVFPAEIIFIAVPTPSLSTGAFDTSYVVEAAEAVASYIRPDDGYKVIAIISTVLPTTVRQVILPVIMEVLGPPSDAYGLAYNAQFIAMGTVIENMLNPEFVLIGELDKRSGDVLEKFYQQLVQAPICRMSIESAEVTKLCYNTFLGVKITIANAMMELCDNIPHANCDMVTDAISLAKD